MKKNFNYSININQKAIIDSGLDIDIIDAAIIDGISRMFASSRTTEMIHNGASYKWIAAQKICDDLPILGFKKGTVAKRINKLVDIQVLDRCPMNQNMGASYFKSGANWDCLFQSKASDENANLGTEIPSPYDIDTKPLGMQIPSPYDVDTKYHNTNNHNTNNHKIKHKEEFADFSNQPQGEKVNDTLFEKPEPKSESKWILFVKEFDNFHRDRSSMPLDFPKNGKPNAMTKGLSEVWRKLKLIAEDKHPNATKESIEEEALKAFVFITKNWGKIDPYLQGQFSPNAMASKIAEIIAQIKNGNPRNQNQGRQSAFSILASMEPPF